MVDVFRELKDKIAELMEYITDYFLFSAFMFFALTGIVTWIYLGTELIIYFLIEVK